MDILERIWAFPAPEPWKTALLAFAALSIAVESMINASQLRHLERESSPDHLQKLSAIEASETIFKCTIAKTRSLVRIWNNICFLLQLIALVAFDIVPKLWHLAGVISRACNFPWLSVLHNAAFLALCASLYIVFNGPVFLYQRRLQKQNSQRGFYGRENWKGPLTDMANGRPGLIVLGIAVIAALVSTTSGEFKNTYMFLAGLFQTGFAMLYAFNREPSVKKLSLLETGRSKEAIKDLAVATAFPLKGIYILDTGMDAAQVDVRLFGWPRRTKIAISDVALGEHTTEEIIAILAQQLGRWKHGAGTRLLALSQLAFSQLFFYLALTVTMPSFYEVFGFVNDRPSAGGVILFAVGIAPAFSGLWRVQINSAARRFQFEADAYAARLGYSSDLSRVLVKAQALEHEIPTASWWYSLYYYDGCPLLSERLAALERMREGTDKEEELVEGMTATDGTKGKKI